MNIVRCYVGFQWVHRAQLYELNPTTPFQSNWHIEVIAAELEACRRGETRRLIIDVRLVHSNRSARPSLFLPGSLVTIRVRRLSWPVTGKNSRISYQVIVGLFLQAPSIRICFQLDCQRSGKPCRSSLLQETVFEWPPPWEVCSQAAAGIF